MKKSSGVWVGLSMVCALSVACSASSGAEPEGARDVESAVVTDPVVIAELEEKANLYAQALLDNAVEKLDGMVSNEVKARAEEMKSDMSGFAAKMGNALRSTLRQRAIDARDIVGLFSVKRVTKDGTGFLVEVEMGGKNLEKPLYFVQEDGEYKF